jgi:hypothetical protein
MKELQLEEERLNEVTIRVFRKRENNRRRSTIRFYKPIKTPFFSSSNAKLKRRSSKKKYRSTLNKKLTRRQNCKQSRSIYGVIKAYQRREGKRNPKAERASGKSFR